MERRTWSRTRPCTPDLSCLATHVLPSATQSFSTAAADLPFTSLTSCGVRCACTLRGPAGTTTSKRCTQSRRTWYTVHTCHACAWREWPVAEVCRHTCIHMALPSWCLLCLSYIAEFGNGNGYKPNQPAGTDDPTGIYLHNGYWGAIASLGAGTCMYVVAALGQLCHCIVAHACVRFASHACVACRMCWTGWMCCWAGWMPGLLSCLLAFGLGHRSWWWDTYIDPAWVYWRYTGASAFAARTPWTKYTWSPAQATIGHRRAALLDDLRVTSIVGFPVRCAVAWLHGPVPCSVCVLLSWVVVVLVVGHTHRGW